MQASDCFITVISFGIVNEGAPFVNEELDTVDRPHAAAGDRKEGVRKETGGVTTEDRGKEYQEEKRSHVLTC